MARFSRFLVAMLSLFGGLCAVSAQSVKSLGGDAAFSDIPVAFTYLTIDEGLSSNTVRALMQDGKGFVWMGTSRGLNGFDGHRVVPVGKTRSLSVTALVEMGDTIWLGTENGLYLYLQRLDSVKRYTRKMKKVEVEHLHVSDMKADQQGNLWLATMNAGMLRLHVADGSLVQVPTPRQDQAFGCVYVNRKGEVFASSNWASVNLVRYHRQHQRFEEFPLHYSGEHGAAAGTYAETGRLAGIAMTEDASGKMWLGMWNGGLVSFDASTGKAEQVFPATASRLRHIHSLLEVEKGCLMVGSDEGLAVMDVKSGRTVLHTRSDVGASPISDNFVYPLLKDREGGIWIGTYYGGVSYTHKVSGNFMTYEHTPHGNSVSGNVVNHFCEDGQNRLWLASDDGGLCFYDPTTEQFTSVRLSSGGSEHNVHALCVDGDQMYVGTYTQGIDIVDVRTLAVTNVPTFVNEKGEYFDASSYAMCCDRRHRIWVGTFNSVAIFHPGTRSFTELQQVGGLVTDLMEDYTDCVWVATDGDGLWSCDHDGHWRHYLDFDRQELPEGTSVSVNSLFEDGSGMLWVGTSTGLFSYAREEDVFRKADLLAGSIAVYGITAVEGKLWLSTSAGILCYSLTERKVVQVYKGGGNIGSTNFLPAAAYRGYDGRVYFGTTNGFVAFMPQFMHRNEVQPRVVFTGLDIFNRPVPVGGDILPQRLPYMEELRLSYRESVFRISFSAMSYLQPSDIFYSYYLEGFDDGWIEAGNQPSVTYTNLSPGTYTLHVRATTNEGLQSEDATLRIVITPPFYWNTPAKILYLLLIACAIFFYVRFLLRRKEKRHVAEIQEMNIQKEQEIQELNTQKEQEIQEINIQKEQEVHDARIRFMTINDKDQAFLDKMETVIEQNFSNPDLSVDYLASELNVSRSGLFAKIKALADVTPNEMIQVIRLKHAASLLLSGNYRVNEVCYMVGFSSPSYFAKCFQKQYGCTPVKYKG